MPAPSLEWERLPPKIKALGWMHEARRRGSVAPAHFCEAMARQWLLEHISQKTAYNNPTRMSTIATSQQFSYISSHGTSPSFSPSHPTGTQMNFQIETGVPVPKRTAGRTGSKYPFGHLEVGQSFLVPASDEDTEATIAKKVGTLRSAIGAFNKRNPGHGKFAVRPVAEGVRVWRTE